MYERQLDRLFFFSRFCLLLPPILSCIRSHLFPLPLPLPLSLSLPLSLFPCVPVCVFLSIPCGRVCVDISCLNLCWRLFM